MLHPIKKEQAVRLLNFLVFVVVIVAVVVAITIPIVIAVMVFVIVAVMILVIVFVIILITVDIVVTVFVVVLIHVNAGAVIFIIVSVIILALAMVGGALGFDPGRKEAAVGGEIAFDLHPRPNRDVSLNADIIHIDGLAVYGPHIALDRLHCAFNVE